MFRAMTYQERQDHPRRCRAHRQDGQPCGRFAIVGGTVCTTHGGGAPQVRRKAMLRQYFELDQKAQAQAAINVFLPPELHPLVSGGGRGHRKAAKPAPEPAPAPQRTVDGIAAVPRNRETAAPYIVETEPVDPTGPRDRLVDPPHRAEGEMRGPLGGEDDDGGFAAPTGPQLTTLEDAVAEQTRANALVRRQAAGRYE